MAKLAMAIAEKQNGQNARVFLEALINCVNEWYREREKLIKTCAERNSQASSDKLNGTSSRKWYCYVSFLTELYLQLMLKQKQVQIILDSKDKNSADVESKSSFLLLIKKQSKHIASLLFDCCINLIGNVVNGSTMSCSDIECLQATLRTVGKYMSEDYPAKMFQLMSQIRTAFINCHTLQLSPLNVKNLMEMIEFRASDWKFDSSQELYYFPYTVPV